MLAHTPYMCIIFYGRGSGDVLSSTGIPFPSFDCLYKIARHPDDLSALVPPCELAQGCLEAPQIGIMLVSFNTNTPWFSSLFLITVVYSLFRKKMGMNCTMLPFMLIVV